MNKITLIDQARLCIGTPQFGMDYGIIYPNGKSSFLKVIISQSLPNETDIGRNFQ